MITVFTRTIIIYIILLLAMRLMGKRQIGELEVSELIITLMLSELAVAPITDKRMPLIHAVTAIFLLLSLEVSLSFALTKSTCLKKLLFGSPIILINNGKIDFQALKNNRIQIDELLSEIRQKDIPDIASVQYAILEDNGKLSVFPKSANTPPSAEDLGLNVPDIGIAHEIVTDGKPVKENLTLLCRDENWLKHELDSRRITLPEIMLMTLTDSGEIRIYRKDSQS